MLPPKELNRIRKNIGEDRERLVLVFSALGEQRRLQIFEMLGRSRNICVSEIARIFKISVPAASQQLKTLEMAGLVKGERTGQSICYLLRNDKVVREILKTIKNTKSKQNNKKS